MKISKAFRLSEEAAAILDQQDNATQYLEDLILARGVYSKADTHIIDLLDKILETMGTPGAFIPENKTSAAELKKPENNLVGSPTANIEQLKSITGMQTANEIEYEEYNDF